ncbi:MAG TPA: 4-hydroxy-tetrahydrodipicolinate reductase [Steroidobacteraceae bacterium]|nr:4-hydroxy-tetrahydrodipicolinate reductase [Steroidobacteraceae bacterium]
MSSSASHSPLARLAIIGASGRMGQALLRTAPTFPQLIVTGAVVRPGSLALGRDAGELAGIGRLNLPVTSDLPAALAAADVALDFSNAAATPATLQACRAARKPLLLGTTGFGAELDAELEGLSKLVPLLVAPNTSVGVALLTALTAVAARALPPSFDVDVLELHHRLKPDAPSGTALALARAAGSARGLTQQGVTGSPGPPAGPRSEDRVGLASLRAGDIVGEHTVLFCGAGEELVLTHRAHDRAIFARGALSAALWLSSRPPGRYNMRDVLSIKT